MPTQNEYNLSKQHIRINYYKLVLLNYQFQNVGEITGDTVEAPTFTIDANSDIRRTCSVVFTPRDSSFDIKQGNKIWLDKYIQIFVGQQDIRTKEIEYTNMGIYLINNPQRVYSVTDNTLTIQGIDLMAKLTGLRNGNLVGLPYLVPQGSNVRVAIIACLEVAGFTRYIVEECTIDTPNDIRIEIGGNVYDILSELRDILPNYQMYFDVDGVFHYEKIPSGKNEQVMVDDDIWNVNLIDYQKNTDFESLKNSIEVYGKTHDIKNYGGTAEIEDDTYKITISSVSSLNRNVKIGFNTDVDLGETKKLSVTTNKTNVSSSGAVTTTSTVSTYPIRYESGNVPTFKDEDTYHVVKFIYGTDHWEFTNVQDVENPNVAVISDSTYIVNDENIIEYTDGMTYTFRTPTSGCDSVYMPYFQINSLDSIEIKNTVKLRNDTTYTLQFYKASEYESEKYFQYMGEVTPYGQAKEENPDSPFYVEGTVGEIRTVLEGGDYDAIYTSELALERAKWELYQRCRLQDNVTLTCIPIYWLDVNWLVNITLPNKYGEEETEQYMVKTININGGTGATQTITMSKYYSYYDEE
jgi:hypothetical protein